MQQKEDGVWRESFQRLQEAHRFLSANRVLFP